MNMLNLLLPQTAAYLDPSATSILLVSITGIAIAIGSTAMILWRKAKKTVAQTLHIDENANKEVEEDLVINDTAEDASNDKTDA